MVNDNEVNLDEKGPRIKEYHDYCFTFRCWLLCIILYDWINS